MVRGVDYLHQVQEAYPGDWIFSSELSTGGQNSDVLIINGDLVFRFPKYAHVLEQLEHEVTILKAIEGRVPLEIPVPSYVSLEGKQVGQAFVGYRMIPGHPLWREPYQAIQDQAKLPLQQVLVRAGKGFHHAVVVDFSFLVLQSTRHVDVLADPR